jgi:hypothetical protein
MKIAYVDSCSHCPHGENDAYIFCEKLWRTIEWRYDDEGDFIFPEDCPLEDVKDE